MSGKEYLGYPEYVVITLPKCGTKTMNKCFTSLGYKGNKIICSPSIKKFYARTLGARPRLVNHFGL